MFGFIDGLFIVLIYLLLLLLFGLLMVVGGINVFESVCVVGDDYCICDILLVEVVVMLVVGFCGGVV